MRHERICKLFKRCLRIRRLTRITLSQSVTKDKGGPRGQRGKKKKKNYSEEGQEKIKILEEGSEPGDERGGREAVVACGDIVIMPTIEYSQLRECGT